MRPLALCAALVAMLALAGCNTVPLRVMVPVAVPCEVVMPVAPVWATDALLPDAGIWDQTKALLAERFQRIGYEAELVAALEACQLPDKLSPLNK